MIEYRLYFLTDGHIARAMELVCETDAQAMARAQETHDEGAMELWSGGRVVATFPSHPTA